MLYPHIFSYVYFKKNVCLYQSIKTHVRFSPLDTIHQNPKRQNHRLRSLWLPMISTSIWEPPVPNVIEAVFILASWLHVFVVRFSGSEELLGFFFRLLVAPFFFWLLVWQKETDINDAMPGHGSTKPKYKSNYIVCLQPPFLRIASAFCCKKLRFATAVCFFPRNFCIQYVPAKFWRPWLLALNWSRLERSKPPPPSFFGIITHLYGKTQWFWGVFIGDWIRKVYGSGPKEWGKFHSCFWFHSLIPPFGAVAHQDGTILPNFRMICYHIPS